METCNVWQPARRSRLVKCGNVFARVAPVIQLASRILVCRFEKDTPARQSKLLQERVDVTFETHSSTDLRGPLLLHLPSVVMESC